MKPITKKIPIIYGGMSLIGTGRERPVSWGNYHDITIPDWEYDDKVWDHHRAVNMWRENLEDAEKRFLKDGLVQVRIYSNFCLIDDDRIPEHYYYKPLHFNYFYTDLDEVKDAYEWWGDELNEFEQFTNPKSYYEKRGGEYNEKTGTITYRVGRK